MAIATTVEKNSLATKYSTDGAFIALFTADPGTSGSVVGEVSGGAYARVSISWGAASGGVITGTATVNVPASTTITFAAVTTAGTAGVSDLRDRVSITSQTFSTAGTYAATLTFTIT